MPKESPSELYAERNGSVWFVIIIVALALPAIGYLVFSANSTAPAQLALRSPHVKIESSLGHGSATHIGNGYFVTAAHVVKGQTAVKIPHVDQPLDVLWANDEFDVALLRTTDTDFGVVPLVCSTPGVGTIGTSHGNPLILNDVQTSLRVAGVPSTIGHWKVAIPVDGAVGPGMSGGGFVVDGNLVGINVGAMLAPAGGGFPSFYGVSVIVPSSVICSLMART